MCTMMDVVCINCGTTCSSIYKQFSKDIIKLTNCKNCGEIVDEYAETEFSIILIDMLLLKKAALRHVLFNSNFQGSWKLIVLFILCDAYEKTSHRSFTNSSIQSGDPIIDLELSFYLMCIKSFLEYALFAAFIIVLLYHSAYKTVSRSSLKYFSHGIVLASYGKLFMLPLLVWSKNDDYCEVLIVIFIFFSQAQVIQVTTEMPRFAIAVILIIISEAGKIILQRVII